MALSIILNCLKGKYSSAQIINLIKYLFGKRKKIVSWKPIYISIACSYRCNLQCDMCLTHSKKHDNLYGQKPCRDMDFETYKQVLNKYNKALVVNLIGCGEPLLNKDFFQMVEYASKAMRMYVVAGTNGTLVGKYKQKIVISSLDKLMISINSHNTEDFIRLTGMSADNFGLIKNNTMELVKLRDAAANRKLKIWLSFILDNKNYLYLTEMINLAHRLGVDAALFLPFIPSPKDGFRAEERCLFSDDPNVLKKFNQVKAAQAGSKIKIILPRLLDREMLKQPHKFRYCKVPFYVLTVDGEGNIGGCSCQLLDNSRNGKFYENDAWNNAYFQQLRSKFIDSNPALLEPCAWCYYNLPR